MPLSDNTNALLKAAAQNDVETMNVLLSADLQSNFIDTNGFMYHMASQYQSRERGRVPTRTLKSQLHYSLQSC